MPPFAACIKLLHPLKIAKNQTELEAILSPLGRQGKRVGLVPTMGALHEGHLSLVREALLRCDVVVCSIFVNPTQFNDARDFERYPRVPEEDTRMLESARCDVLFLPSEQEIYPDAASKTPIDFGYLETVLEGKYRPGHFRGVGMVVKRLFELVNPDVAFFGLKDFQQFMIIQALKEKLGLALELVGMPTIREQDGLAMSSRNRRLNPDERAAAALLPKILFRIKEKFATQDLDTLRNEAIAEIEAHPLLRLDYLEFADHSSLQLIRNKNEAERPIVLLAVYTGPVRLIDNLAL